MQPPRGRILACLCPACHGKSTPPRGSKSCLGHCSRSLRGCLQVEHLIGVQVDTLFRWSRCIRLSALSLQRTTRMAAYTLQSLASTQLSWVASRVNTCRPLAQETQASSKWTMHITLHPGQGAQGLFVMQNRSAGSKAPLTLGLRGRSCTQGLVLEDPCTADWLRLATPLGSAQLAMRRWEARSEGPYPTCSSTTRLRESGHMGHLTRCTT